MRTQKVYDLTFRQARKVAQSLGLKTRKDWYALRKEKKIPTGVPPNPDDIYHTEWRGWGDWLGNGRKPFIPGSSYSKAKKKQVFVANQFNAMPVLPSLTSLSKIIQEVQSEQQNPQTDKLPPNHWTIRRALTDYAKARVDVLRYKIIPSAGVKIDLDGNRIFILVQSDEEKELVQSEIRLMEYLRAIVQLDGIAIIVQAWQPVTE